MPEKTSVAVIGAGLAGMTSALICARNGHKVTLVEQSPRPGLTVRGFMRHGAYFDTGLHYTGGLGDTGVVSRYLRYLGFAPLELAPFADDCFDEIAFADIGKSVRLPIGYASMTAALQEAFPQAKAAVAAYMQAARACFDNSSLLHFFLDAHDRMRAASAELSLTAFLDTLTDNPHLRASLSMHALLYGVSPDEIPFTQHAYVTASYFDAVHTFAGGGRGLVEAFERRLAEEGVTVLLGNAVRRLVCNAQRYLTCLELADGTTVPADACICTTHPAALADMASDVFRPAYVHRLRDLENTSSAYMLFGVATTKPSCLQGKNMFLCRDARLTHAFGQRVIPEAGPFYLAASPQPAPATQYGVVAIAPGSFCDVETWAASASGKRPQAYLDFKAAAAQRIRDALVALRPELASVHFVDSATPLTMRDYLHAPRGGLYGCKHTLSRFNPLPVTRIPNLWLAGQSIIAPGLMGAMISAFLACGFFLGHTTLQKDITCS